MNRRQSQAISWPVTARPVVRLVGRFPLAAKDFAFTYRSMTHALHLHEYAGRIQMGRLAFALTPGTMTLSPAHEDSAYDLPEPGMHWCIHFDGEPAQAGRATGVALPRVAALGHRQHDAAERFAHIARLHGLAMRATGAKHIIAQTACSTAMQDMLLWLGLREDLGQQQDHTGQHAAIDALLDIIERRLHQPLYMPELADEVGISQNYLAKLFRQQMGMTIPHYLLRRRVETARLLLSTTNLPVKQIALRVGMPDAQHFNKQFRRLVGVSPAKARQ